MSQIDPYEALEVGRDATPEDVKSAYRRLARKYHPDVNPNNPEAEEKFKEVSYAYSILSDPEKKARFDQYGTTEEAPQDPFQGAGGFQDLFEAFFGGMGGAAQQGRRRSRDRDGEDLRTEGVVTLKEVLEGTKKNIEYKRMKTCSACNGTGGEGGQKPETCPTCDGNGAVTRVQQTLLGNMRTTAPCHTCGGTGQVIKDRCHECTGRGLVVAREKVEVSIPAGVEDGNVLRVPGRGSDGVGQGAPGDLYVVVHVATDHKFERNGRDLFTTAEITFAQAALGDLIEVDGIDEKIELEVEPGTQPGQEMVARGKGLPRLHGGNRGDLRVTAKVKVPKKIDGEQQDLLRKFAEMRGEPVPKGRDSLIGKIFKKKP
jgi:molecular chaperone DnaJ